MSKQLKTEQKKIRLIRVLMLAGMCLLLFFLSKWAVTIYQAEYKRTLESFKNQIANIEGYAIVLKIKDIGEALENDLSSMETPFENNLNSFNKRLRKFESNLDSFNKKQKLGNKEANGKATIAVKIAKDEHAFVDTGGLKVFNATKGNFFLDTSFILNEFDSVEFFGTFNLVINKIISKSTHGFLRKEFEDPARYKNILTQLESGSPNYQIKLQDNTTLGQSNDIAINSSINQSYTYVLSNTRSIILSELKSELILAFILMLMIAATFIFTDRILNQQLYFNKQKDAFINNISHELKTPVSTTKVAFEFLEKANQSQDYANEAKYIRLAKWELGRLQLMVDHLMNIIGIDHKQIFHNQKRINLYGLTEDIVTSLSPIFKEKQIEIVWGLLDDQVWIKGDYSSLQNVMYNLIDNAVKYGNGRIIIDIYTKDHNAIISVQDNGVGIEPKNQKKIFEQFFRVYSGNTHDVKGHGLGLSLVSKTIEAHGGKVWVESELGKGSKFVIQLPKNEQNDENTVY